MKSDALFQTLNSKQNISVLKDVDSFIVSEFENLYSKFNDRLFYEVVQNCGGIVIDNWIRLYGCGKLNIVKKNQKHNIDHTVDIILGEDIIGGLFGLKDGIIYYFAPDTLNWENLNIYYANFMHWLINLSNDVNKFYELYRWDNWKDDVSNINLDQGISFYPVLLTKCNVNGRSRKIISIDEIIEFNKDIGSQINGTIN